MTLKTDNLYQQGDNNTMRTAAGRALARKFIRCVMPATIALLPVGGWANPGTGIQGTAHDFSGIGNPQSGKCTFCHTPHGGQSQVLLWNHRLSSNTFSWAVPTTGASTPYPAIQGDTYNGTTAKCLSCHDGSVAIGDVVWWNSGPPASPLLNVFVTGVNQVGAGGALGFNHPVAMPYPWNNAPSTYNGVTTGNAVVLSAWVPDPTVNGIRLYNDDGSGNITIGPAAGVAGIECASCHDPHNGPEVEDNAFLRGTPESICTKCHDV